ncbi:hypothetical protein ACX80W_04090 [Arthrobacter sp. TMN-37]
MKAGSGIVKGGTVLLALAGVPLLAANGIYLFSFRSAEGSLGDIGGIGLALLGFAALVLAAVALIVALPVAAPAGMRR